MFFQSKQLFNFAFFVSLLTGMHASVDLDNGLVGYWSFDTQDGSQAVDSSGNAMHGTLVNVDTSTAFVDGKVNQAIHLDGVDDYINIPHHSSLDIRRTISVSMWIKIDSFENDWSPLFVKTPNSANTDQRTYSLWIENSSKNFHPASADSSGQESLDSASNSASTNTWYHLVTLIDRNTGSLKLYSNNSLIASDSIRVSDSISNSSDLRFGWGINAAPSYEEFDGLMDEIRLYNRILNTDEIAHLYNSANTDTDSDGLSDAEEQNLGTNLDSTDSDGDGLSDYEEVVGVHTYEQINGSFTWTAAKTDAESRGGYLATITSAQEEAKVNLVRSASPWIGAYKSAGDWKWVTNESWAYSNWQSSQPDGSGNKGYIWDLYAGRWDDTLDSRQASYILEKIIPLSTDPNDSDSDDDGFSDSLENDVGSDPNDTDSTPMQIGLQAYYPFDGNASDTSGNNRHGTIYGATNGTDRFNQPDKTLSFDGTNDYVSIPYGSSVNTAIQSFSISTWTKFLSTSGTPHIIEQASSTNVGRTILYLTSTSKLSTYAGGPDGAQSTDTIDSNLWYNLVLSVLYNSGTDSSTLKLYSNGLEVASYVRANPESSSSSINYLIGKSYENSGYFNGWLDDIRFYNRALSAEEVNATYQVTKFTNVAPSDLSISSGTVMENGSVGETVGNFSTTDANDPHNIIDYTYTLVSGSGSTDNALFTLESNGTLKAGAVFDYEEQTTRSIRVQVSDEYAATYEEVFVISIGDVDDTAPVITRTGDQNVTHEAATSYTDLGASANDTLDGNLTASVVTTGTVDINTPGTYTLTYTVSDAAGNAATSVTRNVTVVDTTAPVITRTGDENITHEAATSYTDLGATANDTLDGNLTASVLTTGTVDTTTPGTYTLTYTVSDAAGNAAISVTRNVTVVDTTAPIITRTGDQNVTHEAATSYTDLGATANDTLDGNLTSNVLTTGTVDINTPGIYTLTYTVSDAAGNAAISVTRNVTVVDTTAPVITRTGDQNITHEAATSYTDLGATANDTLDGNLTSSVLTTGTVDINTPGIYTLTYTVSDTAGNAATPLTRNVTVVDTTAPVITRTGDQNVTHEAATSYTDLGATASDTLDGNLTANVVTTGTVDINTPGTYTLTYTVSDTAGNAATPLTRNVTVVDTTAPIITRTGDQDVTHEAATSYTDQGASASDTLDGNLTANVVTTGTVDTTTPGTYTLTYTVSDATGNEATTQQRKITVEDTTAPVISLEGNATIDLWVWETYTEDGATASDTLDGNLTGAITISGTVDINTPGTYTLTYTVSDTAGNAATPLTRTVTVTNRAPTSLTLSNQSVEEGWSAGTLVGSLTTTDPDDATGSRAYTYEVVSGTGYTINGNQLVTASVLDFETVPSTDVLIRTTDQFGGSYEQSFAIATIDAFVPGVSTLSASGVTSSSALLSGKVEDAGHGGGVTEHGFVIGREPDPEKAGGTTLTAAVNGTDLSATASGLIAGRVYFYKAYARNAEGITYGAQERFVTPEEIGSDLWSSAQSVGANWLESDWFGSFYLTDTPWLYHHGLGWMFTIGTSDSDLWIWNDDLGWVWTARGVFPHLYSHQESEWYHWNGSTDELRLFYRYSDAQWVDFSNSSTGGKP